MPTARGLAFAVAIDGKLYVVGGHTSTAALDVVEIFDPVTNSWSTGPTAPTARFYGAGGVIDNSICLTAGQDNSALRRELDILSVEVVPTPTPTPIPTPTPPPTPSPSPTGTPQIGPPTNKDQCKNGGWQIFNTPRTFMNQGDCIQFVNTGR